MLSFVNRFAIRERSSGRADSAGTPPPRTVYRGREGEGLRRTHRLACVAHLSTSLKETYKHVPYGSPYPPQGKVSTPPPTLSAAQKPHGARRVKGGCLRIRGCGSRGRQAAYRSGVMAMRGVGAAYESRVMAARGGGTISNSGLWHPLPGEKNLWAVRSVPQPRIVKQVLRARCHNPELLSSSGVLLAMTRIL